MAGEGKGWISLHRSIQEHWLWQEKPFSKGQAWLDLLLSANHQDKKILLGNELISVKRGSFIISQKKLMERWGWGSEKTRAFLKLLDSDGMIKFQPDKKKTTIIILNYDRYQKQNGLNADIPTDSENMQNDNRTQTECNQNDSRTSAETNNNDNNVNNVNKYMCDTNNQAIELCKYYSTLKPSESITQYLTQLQIWINDYGDNWTKEALKKCLANKNRFINTYIDAILKDWKANGKEETRSGSTGKDNEESKGKYTGFKPQAPKIGEVDDTGLI